MTPLKIILMIAYKIVIIKETQEKLRNQGPDRSEPCLKCKDSGPAFLPEIRSNERREGGISPGVIGILQGCFYRQFLAGLTLFETNCIFVE